MAMLTLLEKLYGLDEEDSEKVLNENLAKLTSGIDAEAKIIGKNERKWIQVKVSGADAKVVTNYLGSRFGSAPSFTDIHTPIVLKGKIIDAGKVGYGIYIDIGTSNSNPIDVLIPLHKLRTHLVDGKKLPLREIVEAFCLHDNFPVSIRLTEIDIEEEKMWAEPSDGQVELFKKWLSSYLDRVIVLGAHYERITAAVRRSGAKNDIVKIEELGFLEYSLLCKLGTDAPGMIKILGSYLPKVLLYVFSPRKVNNIIVGTLFPN